jgi:hypothetical protein
VQERSGETGNKMGGTKFFFKDWNRLSSLNLGMFRRRRKMRLKCGLDGARIAVLHLGGLEWLLCGVTSCSVSQIFKM